MLDKQAGLSKNVSRIRDCTWDPAADNINTMYSNEVCLQ